MEQSLKMFTSPMAPTEINNILKPSYTTNASALAKMVEIGRITEDMYTNRTFAIVVNSAPGGALSFNKPQIITMSLYETHNRPV